jgi:cytochrome P450
MVMVCPMAVHLDPEVFEDPLSFNPWRWQVRNIEEKLLLLLFCVSITSYWLTTLPTQDESQRSTLLKNFIPFGLGIRACPAADFSKIFIAIFLHVLVTNYR